MGDMRSYAPREWRVDAVAKAPAFVTCAQVVHRCQGAEVRPRSIIGV